MKEDAASQRYAKALLLLASPKKEVEACANAFADIQKQLSDYPKLLSVLRSSSIPMTEKEELIDKITSPKTPKVFKDFLKVVIRKQRADILASIQEIFQKMVDKAQGLRQATVISAVALSSDMESRLHKLLKRKFQGEIHLKKIVSPNILGGLVIRSEGIEMDLSFQTRLFELRHLLLSHQME